VGIAAIPTIPFSGLGGTGALRYAVLQPLPLSLGLNASTGAITGNPTVISSTATYTFTITDSAAIPQSTSTQISIVVLPRPISLTVDIAEVILTRYSAISGSIIPVSATGGQGLLTYSLIPPTLPNGITYDEFTGELEGTPTAPSSSSDYIVKVVDAVGQESTVEYPITISRQFPRKTGPGAGTFVTVSAVASSLSDVLWRLENGDYTTLSGYGPYAIMYSGDYDTLYATAKERSLTTDPGISADVLEVLPQIKAEFDSQTSGKSPKALG
jgi:hypothetical protein